MLIIKFTPQIVQDQNLRMRRFRCLSMVNEYTKCGLYVEWHVTQSDSNMDGPWKHCAQ